jgi:peptidoglycan/LPS O-acetylase OafA/YrhL
VVPRHDQYDPYDFLAVLAFPAIIYLAASAEPSLRLRSACLWLGAISYALYITHWPLKRAEQMLIKPSLGSHAPWTGIVLAFVDIFMAAALTRFDPLLRHTLSVLITRTLLRFHLQRVKFSLKWLSAAYPINDQASSPESSLGGRSLWTP